jgi:hypothetical protein
MARDESLSAPAGIKLPEDKSVPADLLKNNFRSSTRSPPWMRPRNLDEYAGPARTS